ncbi:cell wall-binding repeat-containing protein [Euzebya tangerina]|uniref:cell wall-binding repeat-containing protein n=1 Tax=Euzebya tangerina TaxID=591198 RepID=UPI000E313BBC|nr:cell wall-binding repeat-containing protein [Euzebya tangerina]
MTAASRSARSVLTLVGVALAALVASLLATPARPAVAQPSTDADVIRIATFNASLNRSAEGELAADLDTPGDTQAQAVAEIIQRVRPDVLLLNEFDYDAAGTSLDRFRDNYLEVGQNGQEPITYDFAFAAPSNTGVPSGEDLDNDGSVGGPGDAFGFGFFPGQFGMAVLSRYPIATDEVRTFAELLWADMPDARLPDDPDTPEPADWFSPDELDIVRLSSKSHWDVPIQVDGEIIHLLASHPTPPVFDGPEDRNGLRNADEIRFWAEYINGASWMTDDDGQTGGLAAGSHFVIAGDQNADPFDGDSLPGAPQQLLLDPLVNTDLTPTSAGGVEQSALTGEANLTHQGDPAYDTAAFNPADPGHLRADYALPSQTLGLVDAGVFWPTSDDPAFEPVGTFPFPSSDHRLVWVDVVLDAAQVVPADIQEDDPILTAIGISQSIFAAATDSGTDTSTTTAAYALIGRDDIFPDSLAATSLAADGPLLLTPTGTLSVDVVAELERVLGRSGPVYVLGGSSAISPSVATELDALGYTVTRLAGPTRIETALEIAEELERLHGPAEQAVLSRAFSPADQPTAAWAESVTGGAWAATTRQPVLLTFSDSLDDGVAAFLDSRSDTDVIALGGTAALTDDVVSDAGADRIAGGNRFATAVAISTSLFDTPRRTFIVGDGGSEFGWAHLLPASSLAAREESGILLVEDDRVPTETLAAICASGGPARTTVVGPLAADIVAQLSDCGSLTDSSSSTFVLPGAQGAEGITSGPEFTDFLAGDLVTGDIFFGDIASGEVTVLVDAPDGRIAVGLKYDGATNHIYAAGGPAGEGYVYDASTGEEVAVLDLGDGFINDVVITEEGAWFTNSQAATLTFVPTAGGGPGAPEALELSGPAADTSGQFNLNGIAATPDGQTLIVAHSGNQELYTVDAAMGESALIGGLDDLGTPDGILLDNGDLFVVENDQNSVAQIELSDDLSSGTILRRYTDPAFDVPTTVAAVGNGLAIVNAKFGTPDADTFEVVAFPRVR